MPSQLKWPLEAGGVILNTDKSGIELKYLERLRVGRLLMRRVKEETGLNVFQLLEKKQSSVLEYLQGWGRDVGGGGACGGFGSFGSWETP